MDLALLVEQVSIVCPDISRIDIERDLVVTRDVQETVNRIFEGNFLVGAASHLEEQPCTSGQFSTECSNTPPEQPCTSGQFSTECSNTPPEQPCTCGQFSTECSNTPPEQPCTSGQFSTECSNTPPEQPCTSGQFSTECSNTPPEQPCTSGQFSTECSNTPPDTGEVPLHETPDDSPNSDQEKHTDRPTYWHDSGSERGARTCSEKHTDSDDASDCSDLPDFRVLEKVKQPFPRSFDEAAISCSASPSFEATYDLTSSSPSSPSTLNIDTGNDEKNPPTIQASAVSNQAGVLLENSSIEGNAVLADYSTKKQLHRSRSSEIPDIDSHIECIEILESAEPPHPGSCHSGNETMDVDIVTGGCSPLSISSSEDEEEGITLSLLHRIRSKRANNHQIEPENYASSSSTSYLQGSKSNRDVAGSRNDSHSCKDADRSATNLWHDKRKREAGITNTNVCKRYHDISDDEDDVSMGTMYSSSCPVSETSLPKSGHSASRRQDDGRPLPSLQGSYSSTGTLSQESSCDIVPARKKAKRSPEEIAATKQLASERRARKEQEKQEKLRLQQEKKQQKQREAQVQKALREAHKADKPEECLKYVTVMIDPSLLEDAGGAALLTRLHELNSKTTIESQPIPGCLMWKRQVMQHNLGDDLQLQTLQREKEEFEALVALPVSNFVELVHTFKQEQQGTFCTGQESLRTYARNVRQILQGKAVTFIIQGLEKYFRLQKNSRQRNFRSAVLGSEPTENTAKARRKKRPIEDITTVVTRVDVEEALVDLQLHVGCNVRFVETPAEVADMVAMFTKSVAETPFKRERDKATFSFHVDTEWAGGVKVKKDGQGLRRVWRQQLQQFRNVSPEIASSVIAVYPSPRLLLQAYSRCESEQEARKLLQDIVVRRGEGVLATTRRIGPELSKRIHTLMTSRQPDLDL